MASFYQDGTSRTMNYYGRQGTAMDVDGGSSSRATSRFSHLNNAVENQDHGCNNGDLTITAGFAIRSAAGPRSAGAYETRVVPEELQRSETIPIRTQRCPNDQTMFRAPFYRQHTYHSRDIIGQMIIEQRFKVLVTNFDGWLYAFTVTSTTKVETLKDMIEDRLGIPSRQQVLHFAGTILHMGQTLENYNIKNHSTIILKGRLRR